MSDEMLENPAENIENGDSSEVAGRIKSPLLYQLSYVLGQEVTSYGATLGSADRSNSRLQSTMPHSVAEDGSAILVGGGHKAIGTCCVCGKTFFRDRIRDDRADRHCCSPECISVLGRAAARAKFQTPESTKAERIRAQGLVNKRLKLGWFDKPKGCAKCGAEGELEFHHPDYSKADQGWWLCNSHHKQVHYNPSIMEGIPLFICDRKNPPKPRHSKGGRRLPPDQKKQRAPWATVLRHEVEAGDVIEVLACGHTYRRPEDGKRHKQRRCMACRDGLQNAADNYATFTTRRAAS